MTCGSGIQRRERSCENGNPGQVGCFGLLEEQRTCANVVSRENEQGISFFTFCAINYHEFELFHGSNYERCGLGLDYSGAIKVEGTDKN